MIDAIYYQGIFLFIVAFLSFFCFVRYYSYDGTVSESDGKISSLILAIALSIFIGFRPIHRVFADTVVYALSYRPVSNFSFSPDAENVIFDNFYKFMASGGFHISIFFLIIALIYFGGMWVCCRKLFPQNTLFAFLVCLGAFSTFSYGTNGIKAGAAASLFLIAVAYYDRLKIAIPFLLLSLGFHHSMPLPIIAFVLAWYYRNTRAYFYGWIFCLIVAALHIMFFQQFLAGFSDERGAEYLLSSGQNWGGGSGFRIDFVIYSAMPVLVGYWALYRKFVESRIYEFILSIYLITNSVWMLCMYVNFTNRIAYLSWFMYPIVLIYPFFENDMGRYRYKMLVIAAFLHFMFTVMMQVAYY